MVPTVIAPNTLVTFVAHESHGNACCISCCRSGRDGSTGDAGGDGWSSGATHSFLTSIVAASCSHITATDISTIGGFGHKLKAYRV